MAIMLSRYFIDRLGHPVKVLSREKHDPSGAVGYRLVSDTVNTFVNNLVVIMRALGMGSFFFPWLWRSAFYVSCYSNTMKRLLFELSLLRLGYTQHFSFVIPEIGKEKGTTFLWLSELDHRPLFHSSFSLV
jgi:hypothetical protein